MSEHAGEYAGLPIGIEGEDLVIDPSYRWAHVFAKATSAVEPDAGAKLRNRFWSNWKRCTIIVGEFEGEIGFYPEPGIHHLTHDIRTLGCSFAWGIEQESNALHTLAGLIPHHTFKQYLLTGMFLETSRRSGLTYIFRKLKPTVALTKRKDRDELRILCALCLHPIAYYAGSWAGAMCPTDDVIAHLMLMRGDEPMFWRRANQHPPHLPEAGL